MPQDPDFEARSPTKAELAIIVQMLRSSRGWTQETLAEIAGLSVRTVQRIEDGQGGSADTLRAVARAVEAPDMDFLIRAQQFPTEAGLKRRAEAFEREYLMLDATPAPTGRAMEAFMCSLNMLSCTDSEIEDEALLEAAASLFDYLRDYLDVKSEVSHQQRLTVATELEAIIRRLRDGGWTPFVAVRHTKLMNDQWVEKTPWPVTIGYLTLLPKGQANAQLAVPRRISLE
ncbi:helix-turn-helix transcriptional regulator [Azorhizobium sp. AG788]|uniref:helix-turn-helix domain-containing protein n=1 Tax=Azorhizobium sp. AG788 TaxID=2183897 RepID=UPI00313964EC